MVINDPNHHDRKAAPVVGAKRWLPWVIGAVLVLGLLLLMRGCGMDDDGTVTDRAAVDGTTATTMDGSAGAGAMTANRTVGWNAGEFDTYLSGNEALGRSFALERVTFASGSAVLNKEARAQIDEVAAALKARPAARVSLRGYADTEGDAAANQALSDQRTQAVRNALTTAGVQASQVASANALGETGNAPVISNRRVEISVTAR